MSTRFCTQCGQPIPDGSRFCTNCGAPVPEEPRVEQTYAQPDPMMNQPEPSPAKSQPSYMKPKSYLALSILATIFCCLPFGIPAIVFSAKVDNLWNAGQYQAAEDSSRKARTWMLVSVIVGLVWIIAYFALFAAGTNLLGSAFLEALRS